MENIKKITVGDVEYTFEFDRKAIIKAEEVFGFSVTNIETKLISQSYKLWVAGLDKHHNNLSVEAREDLYDAYNAETGKSMEVIEFLMGVVGNFFKPTLTKNKKK